MKKSVFLVIGAIVVLSIVATYFMISEGLSSGATKIAGMSLLELIPSANDFPVDENWELISSGKLLNENTESYLGKGRENIYFALYRTNVENETNAEIAIKIYEYFDVAPSIQKRSSFKLHTSVSGAEYISIYKEQETPLLGDGSKAYIITTTNKNRTHSYVSRLVEFTKDDMYFRVSTNSFGLDLELLEELAKNIESKL